MYKQISGKIRPKTAPHYLKPNRFCPKTYRFDPKSNRFVGDFLSGDITTDA